MTSNRASNGKTPPNDDRHEPSARDDLPAGRGPDDSSSCPAPTIRSASQTTLGHLLLAKQLIKKGDYLLAINELDKALALNPELSLAYYLRGVILARQARLTDARQSLLTAVRLQDDLFQAWLALAFVEREFGKLDEALAAVEQAVRGNPKNSTAHVFRGSILHSLQRKADAAAAYREAIRLSPNSRIAHYKLGSILVELGHEEEAEQQILTALRLNPTDHASRLALGDLYLARGEAERAIDSYKNAIELAPKKADVTHAKLAEVYYRADRFQEAMVSLKLALRLNPKHVDSLLLLGRIFLRLKQPVEALNAFEAAVEIDKHFPEALRLRDEARAAVSGRDGSSQ
jgi:tetratricopeptide (TPR) repeat protein